MMLTEVILNYLQSNRRLVIPQLGAFIAREPGKTLVFSELLKRDDGVLRGLLEAGGMNEIEAAGTVDRFVFDIRHALQNGNPYPVEGLGRFLPGDNGSIRFTAYSVEVEAAAEAGATGEAAVSRPKDPVASGLPEAPSAARLRTASDSVSASVSAPAPVVVPAGQPAADARIGRPVPAPGKIVASGAVPAPSASVSHREPVPARRVRRGIDLVMVVAILAVLLAVGVILYGYLRQRQEERADVEFLEQMNTLVDGGDSVPAE